MDALAMKVLLAFSSWKFGVLFILILARIVWLSLDASRRQRVGRWLKGGGI